jgi:thioredoxin reductase/SAM-dependent methyltransferase
VDTEEDVMDARYDVLVIGGGAGGLGAALTLARARKRVLVVHDGTPRNRFAGHMHGYLGLDGLPPAELLARGRAEVEGYGGEVVEDRVRDARPEGDGFRAELEGGRVVRARKVLVATGLTDTLPDVPGVAERWGKDVLHCPFCHGWEVRDQPVAVIGSGPFGIHQAQMWTQWTSDVTLLLHTGAEPDEAEWEQLAALGVRVVDGRVAGLVVADDAVVGVRLEQGIELPCAAVVVATGMAARTDGLEGLGLAVEPVLMNGNVVGSRIVAAADGATDVPGVRVVGNAADLRAQVQLAAAGGLAAAATLVAELGAEDAVAAVERYRAGRSVSAAAERAEHAHGHVPGGDPGEVRHDREFWEERYRSMPRVWSGRPNPQLVDEVADLPPGTAVDIACGEGGDALWLAGRGWAVTGVDLSQTALDRLTEAAAAAGQEVAARVATVRAAVGDWDPGDGRFDLVTSHFLHLPPADRAAAFRRMAAAVAPGGTLLVVAHHASDLRTTIGRPDLPELFFEPDDVVAVLDPAGWDVQVAEARPREARDPEGRTVTIRDTVVRARRHG